jgi:hypothetical protein
MLTVHRRDDLVVDDQETAMVRWHLSQHPFLAPEGSSIGPIVAIKDVTIDPEGEFRATVPRDTEEVLYIVSGDVAPVRHFRAGLALPAGTVAASVDGRHRGHYKLRNPVSGRTARLLQVLLRPIRAGMAPSASDAHPGTIGMLALVPLTEAPPPPTAVTPRHEVRCWAGALTLAQDVSLASDELLYVVVLRGSLMIDGQFAADGDGVLVERQRLATIAPAGECRLLMMAVPSDLPGELSWGDARYRLVE